MSALFAEGFDTGYANAVDLMRRDNGLTARMAPPEYFWNYDFRFDLRDATRGEQEAVRVVFLAQKLDLDAFTPKHVACVQIVLGHPTVAEKMVLAGDVEYDEPAAAVREP